MASQQHNMMQAFSIPLWLIAQRKVLRHCSKHTRLTHLPVSAMGLQYAFESLRYAVRAADQAVQRCRACTADATITVCNYASAQGHNAVKPTTVSMLGYVA